MSSLEDTKDKAVLIVASHADGPLAEFSRTLAEAGIEVRFAADVYTAMACLGRGQAPHHVIVDIRQLDDYEMRFLQVAPLYFRKVNIMVPLLSGTSERAATRRVGAPTLPLPDLTETVLGIPFAVTAAMPQDVEIVQADPDVSISVDDEEPLPAFGEPIFETVNEEVHPAAEPYEPVAEEHPAAPDSLPEEPPVIPLAEAIEFTQAPEVAGAEGIEPSLHDAVRQRMAGDDTGVRRRKPPGPPEGSDLQPADQQDETVIRDSSSLTADELAALLGGDDGDEEDGSSYDGRNLGNLG